jgi:hypothetical protein
MAKMAEGRVLTSSGSCLQDNLYNCNLGEIRRYKEANSFTYVGNRIKWIVTFETFKHLPKMPLVRRVNGFHQVANIRNF